MEARQGSESGDTAGSGEPVVRCESLVREYRRGAGGRWIGSDDRPVVKALDGVDLRVERGEIVGLRGPSGSGKTTLLHLAAGLDSPTEGSVRLADHDVTDYGERGRAKLRLEHVGLVFQRFHLLPSLSARANVALPLVERGVSKRKRRERATELLERVGLGDRLTHRPGELSGGEQQRVAIARALATDPELLVADEPTGELDSETGDQILDVFEDLRADHAILLASHDEATLEIADRIHSLQDGRFVESRTASDEAGRERSDARAARPASGERRDSGEQ